MTENAPPTDNVIAWLLDGDPAIRWQVMRDLLDEPEQVWQAERAKVETHGWGADLLARQGEDGLWDGGVFVPAGFTREAWQQEGQPWTGAAYALNDLREWGLDPRSEAARRVVRLVGENGRWDEGDQPFWEGEVEECINGRLLADGAYFGVDMVALAARLVSERQPDGGWNCERANGSVRSSFDSTINVLEGLLEFERATGGTPESRTARQAGKSSFSSETCSAARRPASRRTRTTSCSGTRTAGSTASSAPLTTCAPEPHSPEPPPTRVSPKPSITCAVAVCRTAGGRWMCGMAGGSGSRSTRDLVCRPAGSPSRPSGCCVGLRRSSGQARTSRRPISVWRVPDHPAGPSAGR